MNSNTVAIIWLVLVAAFLAIMFYAAYSGKSSAVGGDVTPPAPGAPGPEANPPEKKP